MLLKTRQSAILFSSEGAQNTKSMATEPQSSPQVKVVFLFLEAKWRPLLQTETEHQAAKPAKQKEPKAGEALERTSAVWDMQSWVCWLCPTKEDEDYPMISILLSLEILQRPPFTLQM